MLSRIAVACFGVALLTGPASPKHSSVCLTQGRMIGNEPVVFPACVATELEAKAAWKQNIRFLTRVFHALDDLQTEPLMDSVSTYAASGSWQDRQVMMRDLHQISRLLHFAAETQRLTGTYLPEAAHRSRILAYKIELAAAVFDGPLMWLLPAEQEGVSWWSPILFTLLISVTPTMAEHYELTENALHQCDLAGGRTGALSVWDTYWRRSDPDF